jgi:hypothetical protein
MKGNEQPIDHIFRDKLEGYTVSPSPGMLENIRTGLRNRKRKQRIVLMRAIAAAAVIVLALVAGWMLYDAPESNLRLAENETEKMLPPVREPESREKKQETKAIRSEAGLSVNPLAETDTPAESKTGSRDQRALLTEARTPLQTTYLHKTRERIFFVQPVKPSIKTPPVTTPLLRKEKKRTKKQNLSEMDQEIWAMNQTTLTASHSNKDQWDVGLRLAPGYSSQNASHTAEYSKNMTYSNSEGTADFNGGISVTFKASRRLSVESGVYYAQNGQKSGNSIQYSSRHYETVYALSSMAADYFNTPVDIKQGKMLMNSSAGVIEFSGTPANAELSANLDTQSEFSNALLTNSEFHQVFDFVEIPFLFKYTLIDKTLDLDLVGGFSANWVVGNKVYIGEGPDKEYVGQTADISTLNYSGTVGLAVDYALGKKLSLSMEPRINYFLNSMNQNKAVNYHPYRIGLYTGIHYHF